MTLTDQMYTLDRAKPISFKPWKVAWILSLSEGQEFETRRPLKPQPTKIGDVYAGPTDAQNSIDFYQRATLKCPYGKSGDLLYIRTKRFMRKIDTPAICEIVRVGVERVGEISREAAAREGVCWAAREIEPRPAWLQHHRWPEENFLSLWDSIYAGKPEFQTAANPFCWVLTLRRVM